jgi:hypothetical protein
LRKILFLTVFILTQFLGISGPRSEGLVSGVSFLPIPIGSAISVRPLDNSDSNLILQKDFELALKKRGFKIGSDEALVLTFETIDVSGAWVGGGENFIIELSNHDDQSGIEAPRVHFNLFNSKRGGMLNFNRKEKTLTVTPSSFQIDVTIDKKNNGNRIWHGWSSTTSHIGKNQENSRKMVSVLIKSLGQNISRKSFVLTK